MIITNSCRNLCASPWNSRWMNTRAKTLWLLFSSSHLISRWISLSPHSYIDTPLNEWVHTTQHTTIQPRSLKGKRTEMFLHSASAVQVTTFVAVICITSFALGANTTTRLPDAEGKSISIIKSKYIIFILYKISKLNYRKKPIKMVKTNWSYTFQFILEQFQGKLLSLHRFSYQ